MNNKPENPTIPSFIVYKNANTSYQHVINRFCQSKSKMAICTSKKEAFDNANQFWETNKLNKAFCDLYINTVPTYPIKKSTQPSVLPYIKIYLNQLQFKKLFRIT